MSSKDIVVIVILAVILVVAITYIIKEKKNGAKCIGCPHAKACGKKSCPSIKK